MEQTMGHSAAHYKQMEEEFDVLNLTQRIYADSSEGLLGWAKDLWYQYCQFTEKDPLITLQKISINVLYAFFDWLLSVRKDRVGAVSTLQTYWNAFCLVRKKETGYQAIDPLIKSQMHGVRSKPLTSILLRLTTSSTPSSNSNRILLLKPRNPESAVVLITPRSKLDLIPREIERKTSTWNICTYEFVTWRVYSTTQTVTPVTILSLHQRPWESANALLA